MLTILTGTLQTVWRGDPGQSQLACFWRGQVRSVRSGHLNVPPLSTVSRRQQKRSFQTRRRAAPAPGGAASAPGTPVL